MMFRYLLAATVCCLCLSANQAAAQIGFSVTQQNGVVTGGSLTVGGFIPYGGTGVRLGILTGGNQLIGLQNFTFQNGGVAMRQGNAGRTSQNQQVVSRRALVNQFVQAASHFDADKSSTLDKDELAKVAAAVIAELQQRSGQNSPTPAVQGNPAAASQQAALPSQEEMVEHFVKQSLTYDKDQDEALDSREIRRMATALIRSLG